MSLLLPVTTLLLVGLGAFCIFTSMDYDRRIRNRTKAADMSLRPLARPAMSYTNRSDQ
ncbi:hypothetical protein SK3146_05557 [Paenibacillus konkukensis]|uniref:Uncharacterized protein n=1 Tax=Paenibacillus konkukensis TaxID=2020716 RepID=A0ABY4RXY3_9BACL|nr:hypothetical protein SK3146_05557 [Paenibacillus konkukensis]